MVLELRHYLELLNLLLNGVALPMIRIENVALRIRAGESQFAGGESRS